MRVEYWHSLVSGITRIGTGYLRGKEEAIDVERVNHVVQYIDEILVNDFSYSSEMNSKVKEIFSLYSTSKKPWIYPGTIKRYSGMAINDVYKLLSKLEQSGIIESWYEMRCGYCQKILGVVRKFNELPDNFQCEACGNTMPMLDNTVKIYRAVYDVD